MNADPKPKPDEDYRMNAAEFDEAMRKAFGVPPPAQPQKQPKTVSIRVAKERPKSRNRK